MKKTKGLSLLETVVTMAMLGLMMLVVGQMSRVLSNSTRNVESQSRVSNAINALDAMASDIREAKTVTVTSDTISFEKLDGGWVPTGTEFVPEDVPILPVTIRLSEERVIREQGTRTDIVLEPCHRLRFERSGNSVEIQITVPLNRRENTYRTRVVGVAEWS